MKYYKYFLLSLGVIILDQAVKMLVHHTMYLGEEFSVFGDWFKIHYTRNPGMAFGIVLDHQYGKLVLSVFRLFAMVGIGYYLYYLAQKGVNEGLLWCTSLILGGAIGNVIDSTIYGVLFDLTTPNAPTPWFHGEVIDMFYFDLWRGTIPSWVPLWGGVETSLWPIFNIADSSIFVGVAIILVMQRTFFAHQQETENPKENSLEVTSENETNSNTGSTESTTAG
ncbi:lipoprotein signal peptidase [Xanthocytophaga agilis]|uniref:Lipoprotein signal peptidase n=1 Tax=Xanthocytophaga agilis TaxID=3048010 RepID=A0AAE3R0E8_9BACT|nr:lipoprotein signal peptidase [Xanthocytophaga agilis]MDJ1499044.1 lipoprotein signal peptidase [Xanthocytophaga agilis]